MELERVALTSDSEPGLALSGELRKCLNSAGLSPVCNQESRLLSTSQAPVGQALFLVPCWARPAESPTGEPGPWPPVRVQHPGVCRYQPPRHWPSPCAQHRASRAGSACGCEGSLHGHPTHRPDPACARPHAPVCHPLAPPPAPPRVSTGNDPAVTPPRLAFHSSQERSPAQACVSALPGLQLNFPFLLLLLDAAIATFPRLCLAWHPTGDISLGRCSHLCQFSPPADGSDAHLSGTRPCGGRGSQHF